LHNAEEVRFELTVPFLRHSLSRTAV